MVGPAFRIGGHLLRRIAHDRAEILADEGAAEIAGGLGGVDDGGTDGEQILQALPRLAQLGLDGFALADIGPGADQLQRTAGFVVDDPERVLDPDVMSVAMPEAVLDRSPSALDQRPHLLEHSGSVLGMEMAGPAFRIGGHLLRRIAHDRAEILADEGAGEIARGLGGVDDGGAHGEQVLYALLGALQLAFVRLAQRIERIFCVELPTKLGDLVDELLARFLLVGIAIGTTSGAAVPAAFFRAGLLPRLLNSSMTRAS